MLNRIKKSTAQGDEVYSGFFYMRTYIYTSSYILCKKAMLSLRYDSGVLSKMP